MQAVKSPDHEAWFATHTALFHSDDAEDHQAAQRLGQLALSDAYARRDRLWVAHVLHELGSLDYSHPDRYYSALLRLTEARRLWRQLAETHEADLAASGIEFLASHVSLSGLGTLEQQIARDMRAIDALDLAPGGRVIDLGCGPGRSTLHLADRVGRGQVIAIDTDPAAIAKTAAFTEHLPASITCVQADIRNTSPPPTKADAAFAAGVLELNPDVAGTVRALAACVRPGGVIAGYANGARIPNIVAALAARGSKIEFSGSYRASAEELRAGFIAAGLGDDLQLEATIDRKTYSDRGELISAVAWAFMGNRDAAEEIVDASGVDHLDTEWLHFVARVPG